MLQKNSRHVWYALLLMTLSVVCTTAIANTRVFSFIAEVASDIESALVVSSDEVNDEIDSLSNEVYSDQLTSNLNTASAPMFSTIIQGADEEDTCAVDGRTLAKFFLCGTNDDRTISIAGGGTFGLQKIDAGCSLIGTDNCPVLDGSCWTSPVINSSSYILDASDPDVSGEYRVIVGTDEFYFRVTSNPLSPDLVGTDIICGNPGSVEITNVPAGYVYTIGDPNDNAGYQTSPEFTITTPGNYQVFTKLDGASTSACIFPSNTVTINELEMAVNVTRTDIDCDGEFGSISVEITGVPGFYSYRLLQNGSTFSTAGPKAGNTQTWNSLGPGTYSIEVTAANSCSDTVTTIDEGAGPIPITIGEGISPIDATAYATDSFGCGAAAVEIILETSGGTAPYEYSLDGGTTYQGSYTTDIRFDVNAPGTYNITVRDAGLCTKLAAVTVVDLPPPIFTFDVQEADCGGFNDGRITANVSNSNGYNLEFSNDNGVTFQNSITFSNLPPGPYQMVVGYSQDSFSCTTPAQTVTVGTPTTMVVNAVATSFPSCLDETGGVITFDAATGGQGPYEYSIGSGFVAGNLVFNNLPTGTYSLQVRDANGCVAPAGDIVFPGLNKPTDIDFTIVSLDCVTGTAAVELAVTGGGTITNYSILAPSANDNGASNLFTGLGIGSYTFRVTDANGCFYDESFAITDISSIGVTAQLTANVQCSGEANGEGRFIVDGFAGTYRYQIDANPVVTNQTNNLIPLTGLAAGSYTIVVTDDDTNCFDTATLTIDAPPSPLAINPIWTDMNCQNNNRGAVNANSTGGWGGNQYVLNRPDGSTVGPRSNPNFTGLTDETGSYTVTVTDSFGCSVTSAGHTFNALAFPTLTLDTSDLCFDNTNAATLNVLASGGDSNYEYSIDNNTWVASPSFAGLSPGSYTIWVRDGNNCQDSVSRTIQPQTTTNVSIIRELECDLSGTLDARIRVNVSDGYTPYQNYVVSYNGGTYGSTIPFSGSSFTYDTPLDGTYQFQVTDGEGCIVETNVVTITPIESILASAAITEPRCGDANTGIVELVPDTSVGIAPYQFSVDNSAGSYGNQAVFGNLTTGSYTYYVRDSRGCSVAVPFTIGPPTPGITAAVTATDAVCTASGAFGTIDVTGITNGVAPYNYTVLDAAGNVFTTLGPIPSPTANFTNVPQGSYTVVVTDGPGCEDRQTVVIDNTGLDLNPVSTTTPPDCSTDPVFIVDIIGGTAPYQIGILGDVLTAPNVDVDTHDFTGQVQPGVTYFVEVVDALGCRYVEQINPIAGPSLTVTATGTTASCDISGNGTVSYTVSGTTGLQVSVEVVNTDTGVVIFGPVLQPSGGPFTDITGLPPGNYQVLVTDTTSNCDGEALTSILQEIPTIAIDSNTNANCVNPNGQLIIRGFGGTPGYTFAIVPANSAAPSSASYTIDTVYDRPPGTYDIYVEDSAGCSSILEDVVIDTDGGVPTPTIDVVNQCSAVSSYVINVTSPLTSGSAPETTFEYDIGNGFQSSPNFTVANPGPYIITVRDGNGCENTVNAEVFDFFSITASASSQPSCNNSDGIITVETTGGSGNFSYELRESGTFILTQATNIFNSLPPGDYSILVTDLSSNTIPLCNDTATVTIIAVDSPLINNLDIENVSCTGANDGSILVEIDPATATDGPFTYNLYDSSGALILSQSDEIFTDLAPSPNPNPYQVSVTSNRNCESPRVNASISEPTPLQMDWTAPPFSCDTSVNTFNTTTITVYTDTNFDGSGTPTGTGPYSYSLEIVGNPAFDGTNFQSSNTFEVIDVGTDLDVTVTVRDNNGCSISVNDDILAPTGLTFSFDLINPITCEASGAGVASGQLEVIVNEGPSNYRIDMLPFSSGIFQLTGGTDRAVFDLDTPGDYIFAVRDLNNGGCYFVTQPYTLAEFNVIEAVIAEVQPVTCFNGRDGQISIAVNNYSGLYNWQVFSIDPNGVETLEATSTAPFDTNNPIAVPEIITGLPAGNLIVRVEALDTPFCDVASNLITVRGPDRALDPEPQQTAPVTCFNPGRGEITVSSEGGWGGYEYMLQIETATPGVFQDYSPYESFAINGTNNRFENLSAGTYNVLVRDARGCIEGETLILDTPVQITGDIDEVQGLACPGDNNGIIQVINVVGGEDLDGDGEEYLFQLNRLDPITFAITTTSSPQESNQFPNLPTGYYSITMYDGWNCSEVTDRIFIQDPEPVVVDIAEERPPGCGDSADVRLTVTNHVVGSGMTYSYRRAGTTGAFIPFPAGADVSTLVINIPDIAADPGPYQYEVQNGNGCPEELSPELPISPALPLVVALDLVDANIKCYDELTGIIRSEAFGGVGNYRYSLVNNDLGSNIDADPLGVPSLPTIADIVPGYGPQDSGIFRNLGPGTYWVFASSDSCITISTRIEIAPKDELVIQRIDPVGVSCYGDIDGSVTIEASGGTGIIRFSISETLSEFYQGNDPLNPNVITFDELPPGDYEVIVVDELGCSILRGVTITEPEELIVPDYTTTPEICIGASDGTATINIQGGTPFTGVDSAGLPIEYYMTRIIGAGIDSTVDPADLDEGFVRNDNLYFENLQGGEDYIIFVRDANGCQTDVVVPIEIGVDLTAEPIVVYGCDGIFPNSTVTVNMLDTSLLPNILFALDPIDATDAITSLADTSYTWGDLPAGDHIVYIYHENGCTNSVTFTTEVYDPLTLTAEKTGPNEVTALAEGGFGNYEYFFQGESVGSETVFNSNESLNVTIQVRDEGGCVATIVIPFEFTGMLEIPNFFTPDGDNNNDFWAPNNREFFPNVEVKIYDRYGRVVAILDQVARWDGKYEGTELPTGDYWYVVNANDKNEQRYVGHFTLYR